MAYIQASGGNGLQVEEIVQGWYAGGNHCVIQNKNNVEITDGLTYAQLCDKSVCLKSISGSYYNNVTVKKAGYYSYISYYDGTAVPTKQTSPVYVNANGTLFNITGKNASGFLIIYYGATNPFA